MSYSTSNLTSISATNFGALGNRIKDDTADLQTAINSMYPRGGGTLLLPKGDYLTSGYLHVTGHNITLIGEPGLTWIRTAPSGDFKKLNVSGASGFSMIGIGIDAGRTSGRSEQYVPTVNLYSAPYFTISNCHITHSEGLLTNIRGNTYCGLIENSLFDDFHIAVRADSNDLPTLPYNRITISNNRFTNSWGLNTAGGQSYFGAVKFQNIGSEYNGVTTGGRSYGHIVDGNTFSGCSQMGVEFFGYISESVVTNNYFDTCTFGVSIAASSFNIDVCDNVFRGCSNYGIELADAQNVLAANNVIYGATGGQFYNFDAANNSYLPLTGSICYTPIGIIANGIGRKPNFYNIYGNTITDCSDSAIKAYVADEVNIVGNNIYNRALQPGQCFNSTASTNINFSENNLYQLSTGSYFIFLDASSQPNNGILIKNNKFGGSVSQWGMLYYNNGNTGSNNNTILVEGNDTSNVRYCFYGMVNATTNPPAYVLHRNNFGQAFGSGYVIGDGQAPYASVPYQSTSINNGLQHYANTVWNVPNSGVTGQGIWLCAWSGYQGGKQNNVRLLLSTDFHYDGIYQDTEIWATMTPYGGGTDTLVVSPVISASPVVMQVKTIAVPNEVRNAIWVKLRPTTAAASGAPLSIYYSVAAESAAGFQGVNNYSTYAEPADTPNNARVVLQIPSGVGFYPGTYKFGGGLTLGPSGAVTINSSRSGVLQLYSPTDSSYGGELSFGKRIANTTIALYDDLVGPTVYGMGISPNKFRLHVDTSSSSFGFFDTPGGNELATIKGDGKVGIGTAAPSARLHVQDSGANVVVRAGAFDGAQARTNNYQIDAAGAANTGGYQFYVGGALTAAMYLGTDQSAISFEYGGAEKMRITSAGRLGVGTPNPAFNLHVTGTVGFSGIATSTTANVGGATVPTLAVGFITVNITGGNFKIPYYNL